MGKEQHKFNGHSDTASDFLGSQQVYYVIPITYQVLDWVQPCHYFFVVLKPRPKYLKIRLGWSGFGQTTLSQTEFAHAQFEYTWSLKQLVSRAVSDKIVVQILRTKGNVESEFSAISMAIPLLRQTSPAWAVWLS